MKLSFDDKESFKEAVESLRFNNPPSDHSDTIQRMGSSVLPQESEGNEDICFDNVSSGSNRLDQLGMGSEDICFNTTSSNPNTIQWMGITSGYRLLQTTIDMSTGVYKLPVVQSFEET